MKEQERRHNVEIITVDREYDPTQQGIALHFRV